MNAFSSDYQKLIDALEYAHSEIQSVTNPDIGLLTTRLKTDLKRHINALKIQIGHDAEVAAPTVHKPITKMFGRTVATKAGEPIKGDAAPLKTSRDVELAELKEKVEDIYSTFVLTQSDQLMDSLSDIEIRAVAKKAGLPVSEKLPKRIDIDFIDQVKDAIRKQHESGRLPVDGLETDDENLNQGNDDNDPLNLNDDEKNEANNQELIEISQLTNTAILEAYDEDQIKGFATQAGIEVNDKTKVDSKFITHIKEAIKELPQE